MHSSVVADCHGSELCMKALLFCIRTMREANVTTPPLPPGQNFPEREGQSSRTSPPPAWAGRFTVGPETCTATRRLTPAHTTPPPYCRRRRCCRHCLSRPPPRLSHTSRNVAISLYHLAPSPTATASRHLSPVALATIITALCTVRCRHHHHSTPITAPLAESPPC